MALLDNVKLYLAITDNSKDALLQSLIDDAVAYVVDYCHLSTYDSKLNSTVSKMVLQDYTKLTSQGIAAQSYSGVSESYLNGYSDEIMAILKRNRVVKFL